MREILFRAKRVDNGEWVEGNLFIEENRAEITRGTCNGVGIEGVSVEKDTICQYTGLTDKNGNKIWENDIVSCGGYLVVTWKEEFASFCLSKKGWMYQHFFGEAVNGCDCKVIGNIFDNADLLKGEYHEQSSFSYGYAEQL